MWQAAILSHLKGEKGLPMRKRKKAITIRMTDEEYALLCSKLEQTGLSQQAFVISAVTGAAIIPSEQIAVLKESSSTFASLEQQLRGMATNINQMARIANSRNFAPGVRALEKISREISEYRKESEEIWQSIRSSIALQRATGR
jgi:uncharacterized protein (DUF1778 family)